MKYIFFLYCIFAFLQIGFAQTKIFPGLPFERAVAYRMYGNDLSSVVADDGNLAEGDVDITTGVELDSRQVLTLLRIVNDTVTYGNFYSRCFTPHHGVVFYGKKNQIVGSLTICFECDYLIADPPIPAIKLYKISRGFSEKGEAVLEGLMKEILEK